MPMKERQHKPGWKTIPSTPSIFVHFTSIPFTYLFCGKHKKCQERNKYRPKNEERINSKCKNLYTSMFGSDGNTQKPPQGNEPSHKSPVSSS
jgi:hypothetical protein